MTELQNQPIAIRLRHVIGEDGVTMIAPLAHCRKRGGSIDARRCVGCARLRSMEWDPNTGGTLICATLPGELPRPLRKTRPDLAEAAARTTLEDVTPAITICVPATASAERVRALLLERDLRFVAIVDEAVKLVGIVSRSDLLGECNGPARDRAPACTHALPEHAPIAYAIALMAFERLNEVPVVTDDGELVGVVTAADTLAWVAAQMGYVAPPRSAERVDRDREDFPASTAADLHRHSLSEGRAAGDGE